MKIIYKLKYTFLRKVSLLFSSQKLPFYLYTDGKTKKLALLRKNISDFLDKDGTYKLTESQSTTDWIFFQQELATHLMKDDPRFFTKWKVVADTMFFEPSDEEFYALQTAPKPLQWLWKNATIEHHLGSPSPYILHRQSSGNLIHHAYSLLQLLEFVTPDLLKNIDHIWEWGGGYGSFCRLCFQARFSGKYSIFDLPLFAMLQQYYLSEVRPHEFDNQLITWKNTSEFSEKKYAAPDLFVALWSLSETPLAARAQIIAHLSDCKYWLIAFQNQFSDIDNILYFNQLQQENPHIHWQLIPIVHLPNNFYLIGKIII